MKYIIEQEVIYFGSNGDVQIVDGEFEFFTKSMKMKIHVPIMHNFKLVESGFVNLIVGDVIKTDTFTLYINPNKRITLLGDYQTSLLCTDNLDPKYADYPEYSNSPRIKKTINTDKITLERIPEKDKDISKSSLIKKLLPAIVGIVLSILMLWIRPRGIRGVLMLVSTFISFGISMYTLYFDRKESREHNENRTKIYTQYLLDKRSELAKLAVEERDNSNYNYLSLAEITKEIDLCSSRLYERDIFDDDFLKLRFGVQTTKPSFLIDNPFEKLELRYEEFDDKLKNLYEEYKQIKQIPLVIDAKQNIGLVGNRYIISKQMRNILMQILFSHSYLDLQVIVVTDDVFINDYQYAFSMCHFSDDDNLHNYYVHDNYSRDQFLNMFTQVLRTRHLEYKPGTLYNKHFLFIIDNPLLINNHPIMEFLEKDEKALGFSIIQIARSSQELPKHIKTTIDFRLEDLAQLVLKNGQLVNQEFTLPKIDKSIHELEVYYHILGNLKHVKGIKSSVPDSLGFLEMYDVQTPGDLNITKRWSENKTYKSLAALIGRKSETDNIYLDLHEKIHGPHGLIAGTTGSGKSEVIQTYILSLAIEFSPEQVGFLLIDYKGGGMANLFKDMPHHLGSITNLDGYQSMRALASIKSELKRRQQVFSDNNVNHINNYTKLYESGDVVEPLPHLFLISDEFAELKAEQPDFMKELVSAARIGRSLGIHLILATQKPDGVVDDQIWSNSKFKLSLKVAEEADSKALLKTPDAAYITNAGRGYLKVGTNELYELFQSGYSGANYDENTLVESTPEIYQLDRYGFKTLTNPEDCDYDGDSNGIKETELDVVLEEIAKTNLSMKLKSVSKPWLAPLEEYIKLDLTKLSSNEKLMLSTNVGVVDLPNQQSQSPYNIDLATDGNVGIFGTKGMGKSSFLSTVALKLACLNPPNNLKYFILDFGKMGLVSLKDLAHTSEYITSEDIDKLRDWKNFIEIEIESRNKKLMDFKTPTFQEYNLKAHKSMQSIVLFIDNIGVINELEEDVREFVKHVLSVGPYLGIYSIISANASNELKSNSLNDIKNRILLNQHDKSEINFLLDRTSYPMQEKPGRSFVLVNEVEIMQLETVYPSSNDLLLGDELKKLINYVNSQFDHKNSGFVQMPDVVKYSPVKVGNGKILIGKLFSNVSDAIIPLSNLLIGGGNKAGKTNLIKFIVEQLKDEYKITILDDTSYSLLEYSETKNITYLTDPEMIDFNSKIIIINKFNRINKLKNKEQLELLNKLFLMHLNGTIFIIEEPANGLGNKKDDFYNMCKTTAYYAYFGNPIEQNRTSVDKSKFKMEKLFVGDYFLFSDKGINKLRLPLTITGNEDKVFIIPELRKMVTSSKLPVTSTAILGCNAVQYMNKCIVDNDDIKFYVVDIFNEIIIHNNVNLITINEIAQIPQDSNLIINGLECFNEVSTKTRREMQKLIDELEFSSTMVIFKEPSKFKTKEIIRFKKEKLFVITENIASERVQSNFKIVNRKLDNITIDKDEAFIINGKEFKKVSIK